MTPEQQTKLAHVKALLTKHIEEAEKATAEPWTHQPAQEEVIAPNVCFIGDIGGIDDNNVVFIISARTMSPLACKALLLALDELEDVADGGCNDDDSAESAEQRLIEILNLFPIPMNTEPQTPRTQSNRGTVSQNILGEQYFTPNETGEYVPVGEYEHLERELSTANARIAELEQALTGRTVSCAACEEMAKENQQLKETLESGARLIRNFYTSYEFGHEADKKMETWLGVYADSLTQTN